MRVVEESPGAIEGNRGARSVPADAVDPPSSGGLAVPGSESAPGARLRRSAGASPTPPWRLAG
jgi:hypothetical protein